MRHGHSTHTSCHRTGAPFHRPRWRPRTAPGRQENRLFRLADDLRDGDVVFEQDDVKVVVAGESLAFLDGSEVDFVAEGLGSTFQFRNPNVTEECGCGESFTIG